MSMHFSADIPFVSNVVVVVFIVVSVLFLVYAKFMVSDLCQTIESH